MSINDLSTNNKDELKLFVELIQKFTSLKISAMDFESAFIKLFQEVRDTGQLLSGSNEASKELSSFFTDIDAYCSDPSLRDEGDLDDAQLLASAKNVLRQLTDLKLQN